MSTEHLYECPYCNLRSTQKEISANNNCCPGCDNRYCYTWKML